MNFFNLEKPTIEKNDRLEVLQAMESPSAVQEIGVFTQAANEPEYCHWDSLKHKKPLPAGFSKEQAWYAVKLSRLFERRKSEIHSADGHVFGWTKLGIFERYCHEFDLHTGGELMTSVSELKADEKKRLISKGLMDEAIASAQLEGADTTRAYAQKMLREKIKPRNESDQMILNNHRAMLLVESDYRNQKLSADLILEMHSVLTEKTLDSENEVPRLRKKTEEMYVIDRIEGIVYHKAPDIDFVKKELQRMADFANNNEGDFLHPIIKASMLHFWMGYLHPFTDGNGRLARLLFYWYLLKRGYWAFAYLPIASKIKQGGKKGYTMAYVYTEQDDFDLTYFISYLLRKSIEAHKDFQKYVANMRKSNSEIALAARTKYGLNDRQIQLIKYLAANADNSTTIASYISVSGISRATAINDLNELLRKGFIEKKKVGRTVYFYGKETIDRIVNKNED
ncbi:MAG: Fic family protein [bacterium]|nr:Fic family protein [bacterium]